MNPKRHLGRFRAEAAEKREMERRAAAAGHPFRFGPRLKPERAYRMAVDAFHGFMARQPDVALRTRSDYPRHVDYALVVPKVAQREELSLEDE